MSSSEEKETDDETHSPNRERVRAERAGSPLPSCLSMKSDHSMGPPLNLRGEFTGDQRVRVERAGSPLPSCLSMKSDYSMGPPLNFRGEFSGDQRVRVERAGSSVPSCLSMKSDHSMGPPLNFRGKSTGRKRLRYSLESSRFEEKSSEKWSFLKQSLLRTLMVLKKTGKFELFQSHLIQDCPECFNCLPEDPSVLDKFMKMKELFKSHQIADYPECTEREQEDPEPLYIVEKMLETCGSEGSLKITLRILRNMKQKDLADSLERDKQLNESIERAQQSLKTHLKKRALEAWGRPPKYRYLSMKSDRSMDPPLNVQTFPFPYSMVRVARAGPPKSRCLSMKSDRSMELPLHFRVKSTGPKRVRVARAGPPKSRCLSMKSDRSMELPLHFRGKFTGPKRALEAWGRPPKYRYLSMKSDRSMDPPLNVQTFPFPYPMALDAWGRPPKSRCLSMKSDRSMDPPLNVQTFPFPYPMVRVERAGSPVPSCLSMRSDNSMVLPLNFGGEISGDQRVQVEKAGSPAPSCVSMKSDNSLDPPPNFSGEITGDQRFHYSLESSRFEDKSSEKRSLLKQSLLRTLMVLKKTGKFELFQSHLSQDCPECFDSLPEDPSVLDKFMKMKELFKSHQIADYPECTEREQEDPEPLYIVEKMLETCGSEGSLKITLHILRNMKQNDLADSLERDESIKRAQQALKTHLKKRFEHIFEGLAKQDHSTLLNEVYTEHYITEGGSRGVNDEHEVRQIEIASKRQTTQETPIPCDDIFKPLHRQEKPIRTVLTKGIAGIGKTVSVQKFILDWAEGKTNQDVDFIFTLPFRDLNLEKEREFSLMQLLQHYFPQLKGIRSVEGDEVKVVFIFDGLDECRLPLDFQSNKLCYDITESSSVDALLTNLILGNLLPSALLWITSRPAATKQIPPECVQQVTEIQGFNDPQKEEYFRKKIRDQKQASTIISHIKSSRSLYIMCHIPVFCWISATVLGTMLGETESGDLPRSLTEMYTHFLLIQTNVKNQKYHGANEMNPKKVSESDTEIILKLGQLAFLQLKKGNLIFYEADLRESGIDVSEASVYSGMCREIFKEECGLDQEKVYCFVHLSIQEYLAALFAFHSCVNENRNVLRAEESKPHSDRVQLSEVNRSAVDQALESKNGHLDLFLRFLLGLSLDSIQTLLGGILTQTGNRFSVPDPQTGSRPQTVKKTVQYIKKRIREESSADRTINLFHCLNELNDNSLVEEIQNSLRSGKLSHKKLEPDQCSALTFVLLMSEEILDEFDLKIYNTSAASYLRLVPVVRNCRKAILGGCELTEMSFDIVASALQSSNSPLRDLDLSNNYLRDSGVELLCAALMSPNCKLQTLGLNSCKLTEKSCEFMASALQSSGSPLRDLDLSNNYLGDSGVKLLCAALMSPNCKLQRLGLGWCNLTEGCCDVLASVLRSPHSELRDLELRDNELQDSGVRALSAGLEDPYCKLQRLGLSGCRVTQRGCNSLASALCSNPSHLRELDLRYNHPGDSGVRALSAAKLDTLTLLVNHGGQNRTKPGPRKYGCQLTLDPNTAHRNLSLSEGNRRVTHTPGRKEPYPDHPERFEYWPQVVCRESVSERSYWEAEWSLSEGGVVYIAVTDKGISRKGLNTDCVFGLNKNSWSLECIRGRYLVSDNGVFMNTLVRPSPYHRLPVVDDDADGGEGVCVYRVGVYVDRPASTLSFYSISDSDTLTLVHRFHTHFTQHTPLCAGFKVWNSSVSLYKLE